MKHLYIIFKVTLLEKAYYFSLNIFLNYILFFNKISFKHQEFDITIHNIMNFVYCRFLMINI